MAGTSCVVRYQERTAMNASAGARRHPSSRRDRSLSPRLFRSSVRSDVNINHRSSKESPCTHRDESSALASRASMLFVTEPPGVGRDEPGYQGRSPCLVSSNPALKPIAMFLLLLLRKSASTP